MGRGKDLEEVGVGSRMLQSKVVGEWAVLVDKHTDCLNGPA